MCLSGRDLQRSARLGRGARKVDCYGLAPTLRNIVAIVKIRIWARFKRAGCRVSFYSQVIFPVLCDLVLNRPFVAKHRRELLTHAGGAILEIGFGTGLNLPHYPSHVHSITTVDPNPGMLRRAERRIAGSGIAVDRRILSSERLPFEDCVFDCVVSTFTLCSIEKVTQALAEV